MRMVAVVLGGGVGQRLGAGTPKQLLTLGGTTLIERCVAAFEAAPGVDEILVVMARGYTGKVEALLAEGGYRKVTGVIEGGQTRPDSTRAALAAIAAGGAGGDDCGVLLHDAARPLVDQRIIADCVAALAEHDAAGVAVPASDTMVVTADGVMRSMPRRETLHRCQTPQCFRLLGDHPRARAGRGRPRVLPHRRLRGGDALPAGRAGAHRAGQRAQHQGHLPAGPSRRRGTAQLPSSAPLPPA